MVAAVRFATWVGILELVWAMLVGTTQSTELIAGLVASTVVAGFVEALRRLGVLEFTPTGRGLGRVWRLPGQMVFDLVLVFVVLGRALAAGRRVRGEWVEISFRVGRGRHGRFVRAAATMLGNESANTIAVEVTADRAVLHSLEPRAFTGRSVL